MLAGNLEKDNKEKICKNIRHDKYFALWLFDAPATFLFRHNSRQLNDIYLHTGPSNLKQLGD